MAIYVDCGRCSPITHQVVFDSLSHAAVGQINFMFGRLLVNGKTLSAISTALRRGSIGAESDPMRLQLSKNAAAHWSTTEDKFVFGKEMPSRAVVIHEAIHALQDRVRFPTSVTQAEATANLGEAIFKLAVLMLAQRISVSQAAQQLLPRLAAIDAAAIRVAVRRRLVGSRLSRVHPNDLVEIERAIAAHPAYKAIAGKSYPFNGLRRP